MLICPICGRPLTIEPHRCYCAKGHSFDRARSGYVHLLPVQHKHAKIPGDNELMVKARRAFLSKGYYQPLAEAVCTQAAAVFRPVSEGSGTFLDAGCGEGYYTDQIDRQLRTAGNPLQSVGVDISKIALDQAAKRTKNVLFAVASAYHLPIADRSVDLLTCLFAPYSGKEFCRVLRPGGSMLLVVPGEDHLWELKQAVYERPYKNQVKSPELEGFVLEGRQRVESRLHLTCAEDIAHLFQMTPYYYKTGAADQQRLLERTELVTGLSFELFWYRRNR